MKEKFLAFMRDYKALCLKHQMYVAPSMYPMEVWDYDPRDFEMLEPHEFVDMTKE